jgi:hypothetical protein
MKRTVWIIDIDNTLTLPQNVTPVTDADWEAMFASAQQNTALTDALRSMIMPQDVTVICTGRKLKNRATTETWLRKAIPYTTLLMRKDDDNRRPAEVKQELFKIVKETYPDYVMAIIDDDDDVRIMAWKSFTVFVKHPRHITDSDDGGKPCKPTIAS